MPFPPHYHSPVAVYFCGFSTSSPVPLVLSHLYAYRVYNSVPLVWLHIILMLRREIVTAVVNSMDRSPENRICNKGLRNRFRCGCRHTARIGPFPPPDQPSLPCRSPILFNSHITPCPRVSFWFMSTSNRYCKRTKGEYGCWTFFKAATEERGQQDTRGFVGMGSFDMTPRGKKKLKGIKCMVHSLLPYVVHRGLTRIYSLSPSRRPSSAKRQ